MAKSSSDIIEIVHIPPTLNHIFNVFMNGIPKRIFGKKEADGKTAGKYIACKYSEINRFLARYRLKIFISIDHQVNELKHGITVRIQTPIKHGDK